MKDSNTIGINNSRENSRLSAINVNPGGNGSRLAAN